jgi:hypothetical protein
MHECQCDVGNHAGSFCCYVTPSPYPLSVHSNSPLCTRMPYHVYGRFETLELVITRKVSQIRLEKPASGFSVMGG